MRKSVKTKARQSELYKQCVANGGHKMQTVDKRTNQQRCSVCDYATEN